MYPRTPQIQKGYLKHGSDNNTKSCRKLQDDEVYNVQYSYDITIKIHKLMITWVGTVELTIQMSSKNVHTQSLSRKKIIAKDLSAYLGTYGRMLLKLIVIWTYGIALWGCASKSNISVIQHTSQNFVQCFLIANIVLLKKNRK